MSTSGTTSEQAAPASDIKVTASAELQAEIERELKLEDPAEGVAKAILAEQANG